MLSEQCNSILSVVWITSWHVQIIDEIEHLELSNRGEDLTNFLLKLLLHLHLKEIGICVVVEVDDLLKILITSLNKVVEHTFDNLSFTTTGHSNQDRAVVDLDELSHKILC